MHVAARRDVRRVRRDGRRRNGRRAAGGGPERPARRRRPRRPARHRQRAEDAATQSRRPPGSRSTPTSTSCWPSSESQHDRGHRVPPGDGIGPEVLQEALRVLAVLAASRWRRSSCRSAARRSTSSASRCRSRRSRPCRSAQAVLLGAVGGPRWDGGSVRPEAGLLGLRQALDVYANLRPAKQGDVDLIVVRELVGGLYFGARGLREDGPAFDTCEYTRHRSSASSAAGSSWPAAAAGGSSRSTRRTSSRPRASGGASPPSSPPTIPDVELRHALVDSFAMSSSDAETVDVVVTENMFGDILSDIAAAVTGGLGLAASASLGDAGPGIFEPVHGSAPDLVGTRRPTRPRCSARSHCCSSTRSGGPISRRRSCSGRPRAGDHPTPDLGGTATTRELGDAVHRGDQGGGVGRAR